MAEVAIETKICTKCGHEGSILDFGDCRNVCIPCLKKYEQEYRKNNRDVLRMRNRRYHQQRKAWIDELKSKPCMDCHNEFPSICMDFDHRPKEDKKFNLANSKNYTKKIVLAEIAKCDLVCSNCHRIRTENRR